MATADGSVLIAFEGDTSDMDRELGRLKKEILKTESDVAEASKIRDKLSEQGLFQETKLKEEHDRIKDMKRQIQEMRAASPGLVTDSAAWEKNQTNIQQITERVTRAQQQVASMEAEWQKTLDDVEKYDRQIERSNTRIEAQTERAGELQRQIDATAKNSSRMGDALASADDKMNQFTKRFAGLAKRALVFSVITKAFTSLRGWMGDVIMQNEEARRSLAQLKGALLTLAQPIIEVVIPAFITLVNVLAKVVAAIAKVFAWIFGTTAEQAAENAGALYDEQEAIKGVGSAAKKAEKQLASFDEINKLSNSMETAGSAESSGGLSFADLKPDFSLFDETDEKLDSIATVVGAIGAGLLTWNISKGFMSNLPSVEGTLKRIGAAALVTVTFILASDASKVINDAKEMAASVGDAAVKLFKGDSEGADESMETAFQAWGSANTKDTILGGIGKRIFSFFSGISEEEINGFFNAIANGDISLRDVLEGGGQEQLLVLWDKMKEVAPKVKDTVINSMGFWRNTGTWINEKIVQPIKSKWGDVKSWWGDAKSWLDDHIPPEVKQMWDSVAGKWKDGIDLIKGAWNSTEIGQWANTNLISPFKSLFSKLGDLISGESGKISQQMKDLTKSISDGATAALNAAKQAMSSVQSTLSNNSPKITLQSAGKNAIRNITVPKLAQGAVIPPNREFMAVLGDQKRGTNIEAPLSTIEQAVENVISRRGLGGSAPSTIILQLDKREMARAVYDLNKAENKRIGVNFAGV